MEDIRTIRVFKSMWEYLEHYGATVENYELSPAPYEGERIVGSFKPIEDVNFGTHSSDMVEIDGTYYQHVNWGEDDYVLIPESDLEAEFWTVYYWVEKLSGYASTGQIFETEAEARAEAEAV